MAPSSLTSTAALPPVQQLKNHDKINSVNGVNSVSSVNGINGINGNRKRPRYVDDDATTASIAAVKASAATSLSTDLELQETAAELRALYAPSAEAKIWAVAAKQLHNPTPPVLLPEYTEPGGTDYVYRDRSFWTSGFFPGSLYLLLERRRKRQQLWVHQEQGSEVSIPESTLRYACQWWTESLHANATLLGTHDLGFMLMPWARRAWELERDGRALATIITGAQTLAARFSPVVGALRSWDMCVTNIYTFREPDKEFLMIIDNMMNLDLLFYAASQTGDRSLYDKAVAHARTTMGSHIRDDGSTVHLVVFDAVTGDVTSKLTNQGYSSESCWARGQAWAIAGFAETYHWTRDPVFFDTACRCADYLLARLAERNGDGDEDALPWDFDAARLSGNPDQPPDTSAALVAAYGMLLLHEVDGDKGYLAAALRIVATVCRAYLCPPAQFVVVRQEPLQTVDTSHSSKPGISMVETLEVDVGAGGIPAIVRGATINNFEHAPRRWANHSLVYADYYFLLIGNKLLDMGLAPVILEGERAAAAAEI
ncbi:hypothetical protein SCUCBS95973_001363 [Sporothrix curviconia]|uniref:Unsaturated glucuronyl hydrolase n=1 Tax=Sporothrix curviconia TaxID=1260050 RepID=A0ABP0AY87_9PEZI